MVMSEQQQVVIAIVCVDWRMHHPEETSINNSNTYLHPLHRTLRKNAILME